MGYKDRVFILVVSLDSGSGGQQTVDYHMFCKQGSTKWERNHTDFSHHKNPFDKSVS